MKKLLFILLIFCAGASYGQTPTSIWGKYIWKNYKNNAAKDSILTTDSLGNMILKKFNFASSISLTTTGTGAATYNSTTGVLNIPNLWSILQSAYYDVDSIAPTKIVIKHILGTQDTIDFSGGGSTPTIAQVYAAGSNYTANVAITSDSGKTYLQTIKSTSGHSITDISGSHLNLSKVNAAATITTAMNLTGTTGSMTQDNSSTGYHSAFATSTSGAQMTADWNSATQYNRITVNNNTTSFLADFHSETGFYYFPRATPIANQVLSSDIGGGGLLTWQKYWSRIGNFLYTVTDSVGIGTATPGYPLHVNGDALISGTASMGSASVGGVASAGTVNAVTYQTSGVTGYLRSFATLTQLITQASTSDPTVDAELENTTGDTYTWARTGLGIYTITATGTPFTANKTAVIISLGVPGSSSSYTVSYSILSTSSIGVRTYRNDSLSDDAMDHTTFKIEIYP